MTATTSKATEETLIRRGMEDWANALRARDVDGMMSNYAADVTVFGIMPPLQFKGADTYRKHWEGMLAAFEGPINYEARDLVVTASDDVGFSHCVTRISAKTKDGGTGGPWVRVTVCYHKIDGKWMVTHEHVSAPFDMESGKASVDLTP